MGSIEWRGPGVMDSKKKAMPSGGHPLGIGHGSELRRSLLPRALAFYPELWPPPPRGGLLGLGRGGGFEARGGGLLEDPLLRTVGVPRLEVPPLRTVGVPRLEVPPLRTVGVPRLEVPPLRTVGVPREVVPPLLTVAGLRVDVPPLPGFLTLTEGLVTGVLVGRVGLGGVADEPAPPVCRSRTAPWVVRDPRAPLGSVRRVAGAEAGDRVVPGWAPEGRRAEAAVPVLVAPVLLFAPPSTPGRGWPMTAGGFPPVLPGLKTDGAPVRGTALRFPFPSTPGRVTAGVSRTTTCGVPASPVALSLNPKWATPRRGWT